MFRKLASANRILECKALNKEANLATSAISGGANVLSKGLDVGSKILNNAAKVNNGSKLWGGVSLVGGGLGLKSMASNSKNVAQSRMAGFDPQLYAARQGMV